MAQSIIMQLKVLGDVTVIVTGEPLLIAVYVPDVVYVYDVCPTVPPSLTACPVPSPNEIDVPTPVNVTVRGALPEVGEAENVLAVPVVPETHSGGNWQPFASVPCATSEPLAQSGRL